MMKFTGTFIITTLLLTGCASNYNNGVSTWSSTHEQPELLETQEYEKYVVEEVETPEYAIVETEVTEIGEQDLIAVSETTPTIVLGKRMEPVTVRVLDEVKTTSSASRPSYTRTYESNVPDSVVVLPEDEIRTYKRAKSTSNKKVYIADGKLQTGTYSNKSRGPYLYMYKTPVNTYTQVITTKASSTRPTSAYTKSKTFVTTKGTDGGCYVNVNGGEKPMLTKVLCSEQLTNGLVSKIQSSLNAKGYNAGPVTGYMSTKTLDALYKFQTANNLPTGSVSLDTLNSLGVDSYSF